MIDIHELRARIGRSDVFTPEQTLFILKAVNVMAATMAPGDDPLVCTPATHAITGAPIIEVSNGVSTVATLALSHKRLRIVSAHISQILRDDNSGSGWPIPVIDLHFDPKPFRFVDGKMVR